MPSSESGEGSPAKDTPRHICAWCFKPIEGKPIVLQYDMDLPQLRFHNAEEADKFHLALILGEDGPLWKDYAKRMAAYEKKARAAEERELKRLARPAQNRKRKDRTAA